MGCVYMATNRVNGKRYIGMTTLELEERKQQHEKDAKRGSDSLFHKAIRKHGPTSFRWRAIYFSDDRDELCLFEVESIRFLRTMSPGGYNLTAGGDNPPHGPEWSQKVSIAMRGNKSSVGVVRSKELRYRHSQRMMGHGVSAAAREKISKALKGRVRPDLSRIQKGKIVSAETGRKISKALKGKKKPVGFAEKVSKIKSGMGSSFARLCDEEVEVIRELYPVLEKRGRKGVRKRLAKAYGVTAETILNIVKGKTWKHLL